MGYRYLPNASSSIYDGLLQFYATAKPSTTPASVASFDYLLQSIAAEWYNVSHIIGRELRMLEYAHEVDSHHSIDSLHKELHDVHMWRRRVGLYWALVEQSSRICRTSCAVPGRSKVVEDNELRLEDLEGVMDEFFQMKDQAEKQVNVVLGRISVEMALQSVTEARRVTRLTIAALLFLPMSFVASVFSMSGRFALDSGQGWIYFVAAVPLTIIATFAGLYEPSARKRLPPGNTPMDHFDSTQLGRKGLGY
jgi:Mg2+ and Co2+ transporter CorA